MTVQKLLFLLKAARSEETEQAHQEADDALLWFILDSVTPAEAAMIREAYDAVPKWYA